MFRRNVRKRAKLHLETRYSPRALLAGNRVFAALLFIRSNPPAGHLREGISS
jgi:hypothetical protein